MKIIYTDDKKEKYQSVRAQVFLNHTSLMGYGEIHADGFGSTKEEAKRELLQVLNRILDQAKVEVATQETNEENIHVSD